MLNRIIVGVKYCFRYNARNRALARGENPEEVPLDQIPPGRPHRRRREKKLMTMDEVNERFPLTKYKNWTLARANEELPATGGVTAPPSRPGSVRHVEGVVPQSPVDTKHSVDDRPTTALSTPEVTTSPEALKTTADATTTTTTAATETKPTVTGLTEFYPTTTNDPKEPRLSEEDDDDEHIHGAVPVDLLDHPGDSCAICIDTLEQDDDIRGLTCGHAFHAGCLDPWLTSRRACCPLCKADYYVPKPRPEGEAAEEPRRPRRAAMPAGAHQGSTWSRGNARFMLPGRFMSSPQGTPTDTQTPLRSHRRPTAPADTATPTPTTAAANTNSASSWLPSLRFGRARTQEQASEPTPAQLEAGATATR